MLPSPVRRSRAGRAHPDGVLDLGLGGKERGLKPRRELNRCGGSSGGAHHKEGREKEPEEGQAEEREADPADFNAERKCARKIHTEVSLT